MPFNFDKSSFEARLPRAGQQPATINDINVYEGQDATWLKVAFRLDSGHRLEHLVAIDATPESPHLTRVGQGITLVQRLCQATGVDVGTLREPRDIERAFLGKEVNVLVALSKTAGMPQPRVKDVLPANGEAVTAAD